MSWASGESPPRRENAIDVLIDSTAALSMIVPGLQAARSHFHMTGWYLSPDLARLRDSQPTVPPHLLAQLADEIDVCIPV